MKGTDLQQLSLDIKGWLAFLLALSAGAALIRADALAAYPVDQHAEVAGPVDKLRANHPTRTKVSGGYVETMTNQKIESVAGGPKDEATRTGAARARDGNVAIKQEFVTGLAMGTIEAMELFVKRHPDHPLAEEAREHIRELERVRNGE